MVSMTKSKTPKRTSTVKTVRNVDTEISDLELDKVTGGGSQSSGGGGGTGKIMFDSASGMATGKITLDPLSIERR
jgi:hypothetical protein